MDRNSGLNPGEDPAALLADFRDGTLGNVKTSFSGTFHAFNVDKYARRYLGGYCFRFNRRFSLAAMTERIANAVSLHALHGAGSQGRGAYG